MHITVKFTDVYDGREFVRTETHEVARPEHLDDDDEMYEWANDNLEERTGLGRSSAESGYFAEILACADIPELVGREFTWGI